MGTPDILPGNVGSRREKSVKQKMAPFIGFGWGWGDPRTETVTKIDFLLIINGLHVQGDVFLTNSFAINRSIAKLDGNRRPTKLVQVE